MSMSSGQPHPGVITNTGALGTSIATFGTALVRVGLALVLLLIGGLKFTSDEATAIQLFIGHSPLFAWLNALLTVQQLSDLFGTLEITASVLIFARPVFPVASAIGSAMAVAAFVSTVSFLFTTPGVWSHHYGFPALSDVGSFLIKDITLLGASLYTLGEALQHVRVSRRSSV